MKGTARRVVGVFLVVTAATAVAETKWYNPAAAGGKRFWSEATGWNPTASIPTLGDDVTLDNALTTPDNPLVITRLVAVRM